MSRQWGQGHRIAAATASIYMGLAILWILGSDWLMLRMLPTSHAQAISAHSFKGVAFVLTSGLLLYFGLSRVLRSRDDFEKRLKETSTMLSTIFDASPLAITALDPEGKIMIWNPAAERLYGWSKDEAVGQSFLMAVPPDDRDSFLNMLRNLCDGQRIQGLETKRIRKDGQPITLQLWTSELKNSEGEVIGTMGTVIQIDEKKGLEMQLQQAQKMEIIGRLAGGVAHDFNNLLTGIGGYTDFVLGELAPDNPVRPDLQQVSNLVQRAAHLSAQLLLFSRRGKSEPATLSLNSCIAPWVKMMGRLIDPGVDLRFEPGQLAGRGPSPHPNHKWDHFSHWVDLMQNHNRTTPQGTTSTKCTKVHEGLGLVILRALRGCSKKLLVVSRV